MKMHAVKAGRDRPARRCAERLDSGLDFRGCGGRYLSASHHVRHTRWCYRPVACHHRLAACVRELCEDLATVPVHGGRGRLKRADDVVSIDSGLIIVVLATAVDKHVAGNDQANPEPSKLTQQPGEIPAGKVAAVDHSLCGPRPYETIADGNLPDPARLEQCFGCHYAGLGHFRIKG